ncbi:MAG: nucleotidyltransferase domain-containing protein, partial [archaeon]|nr:nucleotidyltransferase domain-containing protein [archaeon]
MQSNYRLCAVFASYGDCVAADKEFMKIKKTIVPVLKRNGVVRAGIFGSFVKGEVKKGSDIDILIEFKG